jgi:hypothetical protein
MSVTASSAPGSATPVHALVGGLFAVLLDVRIEGFDVAVDTVGWIVVVAALGRLVPLLPRVGAARACAVVAAALSLADVVHPLRTITEGSELTLTTTVAVAPAGVQGAVVIAYVVTTTAFLLILCAALAAAARQRGDEPGARRLRARTWWLGITHGVVAVLQVSAAKGWVGEHDPLAFAMVFAAVAAFVLDVSLLWSIRALRAVPAGRPATVHPVGG